ncbi:hypothetical protein [Streptomyces sp. NPDC054765]
MKRITALLLTATAAVGLTAAGAPSASATDASPTVHATHSQCPVGFALLDGLCLKNYLLDY